jgi:hypothetical protein
MKWIRNTGITFIVLILLYLLFRSLNLLPDFKGWFKSQPVKIANTPILIENIRDLAELTTIASFDEVVLTKQGENEGTIIGNILRNRSLNATEKKIVLIAKGRIFAGVDLKLLKENAIFVKKDSVSLRLPNARILDAIVNPSDCEIFTETGNWTNIEINQLKSEARKTMFERATDRNILGKAETKSRMVMEGFFRSLGYKKINIQFR